MEEKKRDGRETHAQHIALDLVRSMPDVPTRTLAARLHREHPKIFITIERARSVVRRLRGNAGGDKRARPDHGVRRQNGEAGYVARLPKGEREPWEKYHLHGAKKVLCLSDIHIPYHDEKTIKKAAKCGNDHGIDVVLLNGDTLDFYSISRFQKDPERRDAVEEIGLAAEFMLWLRQEFPSCRLVFKPGNHEERWDHYIWAAAPVLWALDHVRLPAVLALSMGNLTGQKSLSLADYGWEYVDSQRPVMAGKLPILHGHELPKGMTNPVNMARGAFLRGIHSMLVGHGHRTSQHVEPSMFGAEISTWSQGCLCGLTPAYARINKWNQGWSVIEIGQGGQYSVLNYRVGEGGRVRAS